MYKNGIAAVGVYFGFACLFKSLEEGQASGPIIAYLDVSERNLLI
jgi:hypothetical protein